jgi:hypothetical protein
VEEKIVEQSLCHRIGPQLRARDRLAQHQQASPTGHSTRAVQDSSSSHWSSERAPRDAFL